MTNTGHPEAESALLGLLLCDNGLVFRANGIKPEHFLDEEHKIIFSEISEAARAGKSVSITLLREKVPVSTITNIMALRGCMPGVVPDLAENIIENFRRRRVVRSCKLAVDLIEQGNNFTEAASILGAELESLSSETSTTKNDARVTENILDRIKLHVQPTSTGLIHLDSAMGGGLYPKKSYAFCARMKVGKTGLAATISYNLGQAGKKHLFICGEMGEEEIQERMLARHLGCFPSAFRTDFKEDTSFQIKMADYVRNSKKSIQYQDAPGVTFEELKQYVSSAVYKHKIEGIILDYWQLVGGKRKGQSTAEHLDDVAQWLANYCRKAGIWNITMAQLNQEDNTRGSEGIKLAYDQVFALHREDLSGGEAWIEMLATRYTKWANIGSKDSPGLYMSEKGPYFYEPLQAVTGVKGQPSAQVA